MGYGLLEPLLAGKLISKIVMCICIVRFDSQGFNIMGYRLLVLSLARQGNPKLLWALAKLGMILKHSA